MSTEADIFTLIDFLEKKAGATVLNQPTLWTKDNEEASFFRGQQVAFVESSNTSTEGTATRDQITYYPVGVTLRVRPNITPESAVNTTINLNISRVEPEIINGNITTSELDTTTHVIVQDGETIMLGGILFQNDSTTKKKVPLLGDLPLLGGLFTNYEGSVVNNELLIFITPYVVDNAGEFKDGRKAPFAEGLKKFESSKERLDCRTSNMINEVEVENAK